MRTYDDIYTDYCNWLVQKTGDMNFTYSKMKENLGEKEAKVFLYKDLLNKVYDKRKGMYFFCKFIIGGLEDIGYPNPFRFNNLLNRWYKLVRSNVKLALLCARGHGKSVFFTEILSIYDMFIKPYRRIILISATAEQAEHLLGEMKTIIENNEWLETKKDSTNWSVAKAIFNKGYIMAKGMGSEILGQHVDRIILDDVLRDDTKMSDEDMEDYVDMKLEPMLLNRKGQMIIVGTPKRETDIFSAVSRKIEEEPTTTWRLYKFPAIIDYEEKKIQCPDRFTFEMLMQKRIDIGSLKFAREYQLEFFSRDKSLFPKEIVDPARERGKDLGLLKVADKRGGNWTFVIGVDVARSGAASADYTVATVLAYNYSTQAKQICYVWREKGLKMSVQASYIAEISRNFGNCLVFVEQNNMGQDMIDNLVDNHNCFVESFVTGGKGQKKDELIRFLVQSFEFDQVTIPQGTEEAKANMKPLLTELERFCTTVTPAGNEQFKGMGSHDDTVMSLALANRATQEAGTPYAATEFGGDGNAWSEDGLTYIKGKHESDLVKLIRMGIIK